MNAAQSTVVEHAQCTEKAPGHWVLAQLGKKVLRPGGLELTQRMLEALAIGADDDVVEFAPGLGVTARMALARGPHSYVAVERDERAAETVRRLLSDPNQQCILGRAESTGLADGCASVVYGEAMLTMQSAPAKGRIVTEAARLLQPGGRYGIHEVALTPNVLPQLTVDRISRELSEAIHHAVMPLTADGWRSLLESHGFEVEAEHTAPMHLLEPLRLVRDEGLGGALRFAWNLARQAPQRRRVLAMRSIFRRYSHHLVAITLVARKSGRA